MVIDDLDLVGIAVAPPETHAVLVVYAYAELPFSVSTQLLEAVAAWRTQIPQVGRGIEYQELLVRATQHRSRYQPRTISLENRARFAARPGANRHFN
jgi:hypothetical protein